jgi:hypothetical protein
VLQDGRQLFRRRLQIDAFVPGTEIEYLVPWRGRPVQGDYEVRGTLLPEGGKPVKIDRKIEFGKDRIREYRKETGRQAVASTGVSPAFLAVSVLLAGALAVLGTAYVRLRRGA